MGALEKTLQWVGFRDQAEDELEEYEVFDGYDDAADEGDDGYSADFSSVTPLSSTGFVNSQKDFQRIVTVCPRTYNEAKAIGDAFRDDVPVIMNLTSMSEGEARRMVDFASGLIYGLNGHIERVTNRVFLLSPEMIKISEGTTPQQGRIFNQG